MSNKLEILKAWRECAEKYENPQGKIFFIWKHCPLCALLNVVEPSRSNGYKLENCAGCPMAKEDLSKGCINFTSYRNAWEIFYKLMLEDLICHRDNLEFTQYPPGMPTLPQFLARAKFFRDTLPILELIPYERFVKGEYFPELDRKW
jgi:hypothetical protein